MILLLEYNTKCLLVWAQYLPYQTPLLWHMYFPFPSHRQMECLLQSLQCPGHLCRRIFLVHSHTLIWSGCLPGKITSMDELGIFLHSQHCCQSMSRGGGECRGETLLLNSAGEEARGDRGAENFLLQNAVSDYNISTLRDGRWWEGSTPLLRQIFHLSVSMTLTGKVVLNWNSDFAVCGL